MNVRARQIFTTEYTEAVEPLLKDTEMDSVYSVWERKRPFSVFCGKFSRHFGLEGLRSDECVDAADGAAAAKRGPPRGRAGHSTGRGGFLRRGYLIFDN